MSRWKRGPDGRFSAPEPGAAGRIRLWLCSGCGKLFPLRAGERPEACPFCHATPYRDALEAP